MNQYIIKSSQEYMEMQRSRRGGARQGADRRVAE